MHPNFGTFFHHKFHVSYNIHTTCLFLTAFLHGIFRTYWTRNMYDFVSNNGNYGRSKSLVLTVFIKWFFYSLPLLDNYTILLWLLERNFKKLSKIQKGHIFTEKSTMANLGQLAKKRHFKKKDTLFILGNFHQTLQVLNFNV